MMRACSLPVFFIITACNWLVSSDVHTQRKYILREQNSVYPPWSTLLDVVHCVLMIFVCGLAHASRP